MTNNLRELATTDLSISQMTLEESFVKLTYDALNDIKNKFVEIGFRLREANQLKYYARLGYDSIEDLAEDLFDIKRSSVYQLIAINEKFCSSKRWLLPRYEKFSQSQLVEMLPIADSWLCTNISPDCTVAEIREYKKAVSYKGHNDYCYGTNASRHTVQNIIEEYHKAMTDDENNKMFDNTLKNLDELMKPLKKVQTSGQNPDVLPGQTSIFDKDGLDEEIYDGYALDEQKEKESIEREAEKEFPDNACIPCYGKNLEDMFVLTDDVGKTVYFPGFKFCPYCGRKLYPRFDCKGGKQ